MTRMIKHLYREEDHMDYSIQEIVSKEMDVNTMKIEKTLGIKDEEENIKYLSLSIPKTKFAFMKMCAFLLVLFLTLIIIEATLSESVSEESLGLLIAGLIVSFFSILVIWRGEMHMWYYRFTTAITFIMCIILLFVCFLNDSFVYLLICLVGAIITQPLNLLFPLLVFQCVVVVICGTITSQLRESDILDKVLSPVFQLVCVLLNFRLIYQGEVDSKVSFVITEAF